MHCFHCKAAHTLYEAQFAGTGNSGRRQAPHSMALLSDTILTLTGRGNFRAEDMITKHNFPKK